MGVGETTRLTGSRPAVMSVASIGIGMAVAGRVVELGAEDGPRPVIRMCSANRIRTAGNDVSR